MGIANAPACFQRLLENTLIGLIGEIALIYIDDIIIFSNDFNSHVTRLATIFERLRGANLKLSPKKMHLFKQKVAFLGHHINTNGIEIDPDKVKAVTHSATPRSVTVRSYIGFCSYFRNHIKDFATIADPLHKLTGKNHLNY